MTHQGSAKATVSNSSISRKTARARSARCAGGVLRVNEAKIDVVKLREKATALGFSFERLKQGAGYILIDSNGDKALGADYRASLGDIARYLDNLAADIRVDDVEVGSGNESKPPPTATEIRKSLENRDSPTMQEIHDRRYSAMLGTAGKLSLTGAAETILVLAKGRQGPTLYGRGRDIHTEGFFGR
jgi:hypothetical protein